MNIAESISGSADEMAKIRRDIHAHPELCFEETRTAELIAQKLTEWGIEVHRGFGTTGLVGELRAGSSTRGVGLRADMDALPISESNQFAHASRRPGKMHACGHDGHVTMLLAAARYLAQHRTFDGRVFFVFQPAEEGGGGAREMMRDGLFERFPMEAIFGAHNWPGLEVGQFALKSGPEFASSNDFSIIIRGEGAHAAMPHNGIDPVLVACHMVQAFQTIITSNKRPIDTAVITVTMIQAGEATNAIADTCKLAGTVRTFDDAVLDMIENRMSHLATATAAAFGARCDFELKRYYPPTVNPPRETDFVRQVLQQVAGSANVLEFEPTMAAEDFSFFLQAKPGCFFLIGNGAGDGQHRPLGHGEGPCMLHNPSYDFNDALIPIGATAWVRLVQAWFAPR